MSDNYLQLVQRSAGQEGKVFFLDSGEGNDWNQPEDEWYVEDLSGWLVEQSQATRFSKMLEEQGKRVAWESHYQYCFVKWELVEQSNPGQPPITVRFELVGAPEQSD
jgi:hypothetical protein